MGVASGLFVSFDEGRPPTVIHTYRQTDRQETCLKLTFPGRGCDFPERGLAQISGITFLISFPHLRLSVPEGRTEDALIRTQLSSSVKVYLLKRIHPRFRLGAAQVDRGHPRGEAARVKCRS